MDTSTGSALSSESSLDGLSQDGVSAACPSQYTLKYGNFERHLLKTLLTPLSSNPMNDPSNLVSENDFLVDSYQRERLRGFSTRELVELNVITDIPLKPSTLRQRCLKFLQRQNWVTDEDTLHPIPLYLNGTTDYFKGSSDVIWEKLSPIIVLASRIFAESWKSPYVLFHFWQLFKADTVVSQFTALLHGPRKPIAAERVPQRSGTEAQIVLESFHTPQHFATEDELQDETKILYDQMHQFLRLGFKDGKTDALDSSIEDDMRPSHAHTTYELCPSSGKIANIWILLDYRDLDALFHNSLTDCDRMGIEWFIASVIAHEICHAFELLNLINKLDSEPGGQMSIHDKWVEPYFEDEPVAEQGWAMEKALLGGFMESMNPHYKGGRFSRNLPLGWWFETTWPCITHEDRHSYETPTLLDPPINPQSLAYVVPAEFFENAQQEDFWEIVVRGMGPSALAEKCLSIGHSTAYDSTEAVISQDYVASQNLSNKKLKILGILALKGLDGRRAFDFGRRLYSISRQTKSPRKDPQELQHFRDQMAEVLGGLLDLNQSRTSFSTEKWDDFIPTQKRFFQLAYMAHRRAVQEHWVVESQNDGGSVECDHARYVLLIFNRGMRIFSRQFQANLTSTQYAYLVEDMEEIDLSLECLWMILFYNPHSGDCGTPQDHEEYAIIDRVVDAFNKHANDDDNPEPLKNSMQQLLKLPGVSLVHKSIIQILASSFTSENRSFTECFHEAKTGRDTLLDIRSEARKYIWHQWWRNAINHWIDRGNRLLDAIIHESNMEEQEQEDEDTSASNSDIEMEDM